MDKYNNILIIKPSSLGDIVLALPALSALRESYPDAEISWLIRPEFAPLIENHPDLTKTIAFDRKFLGKSWYNPKAFACLLSLIKLLRKSKFDLIIDFQGLFRTGCLAWLSGCRKRIGMDNAREFAGLFYTQKIQQKPEYIHLVDYYLEIVRPTGASKSEPDFALPINPSAEESIKQLLKDKELDIDNYGVLIPGSVHADKCWPVDNFAELAEKIHKQFGLSMVVTGTSSEKKITEGVKALSKVPIIDLAGLTSLGELAALINGARLVVSNDTGPGHIAAALGVPLVMMFSRANPVRIHPYKRKECVVAIEPFSRGSKPNSKDSKYDINKITVEQVYERVCQQLKDYKLIH
ncbi:MAG: glycosyltransferase family 9 protein [Planctomycetota bacterium]|jgi:lipopolysaccharide heptosyltransferase I